jgi:hypothetical protein
MENAQPTDQAPVQSMEDRIAAQFGLTDDQPEEQQQPEVEVSADEEQTEAPPESDDVEIELEGEKYRVPKKLEKAFLQERDYTQKTQAVAEQRRILEQTQHAMKLAQMEQEFQREAATEVQQLQYLDQYIQSLNQQNFSQMTTDEKMDALLNIQQAERHKESLKATLETKKGDYQKKLDAAVDEAKSKAREVLKSQGVSPDSIKAMRDYAKNLGFTDVALDAIEMDVRSTLVLHKARQFDELQATKTASVQKLNAPVVKPGSSRPMPDSVKQDLALRKAFKTAKSKPERDAIMQKRVENLF